MIIRKTDANNDWTFGGGLTSYAKDEAAIEQNIKSRVLSWMYDCFFAQLDGIDYANLMQKNRGTMLTKAITYQVASAFGVININSIDAVYDPVTRRLTVNYNIDTVFSNSFQGAINA